MTVPFRITDHFRYSLDCAHRRTFIDAAGITVDTVVAEHTISIISLITAEGFALSVFLLHLLQQPLLLFVETADRYLFWEDRPFPHFVLLYVTI